MLLGATMVATCETFVLAQKLGLDLQTFFDISSKASGQNWSMTSYCPVPGVGPESPADRGYQGGFASALMLKDLKLAGRGGAGRERGGADGECGRRALPGAGQCRGRRARLLRDDPLPRRQAGRPDGLKAARVVECRPRPYIARVSGSRPW
jgi:hypothetical protein